MDRLDVTAYRQPRYYILRLAYQSPLALSAVHRVKCTSSETSGSSSRSSVASHCQFGVLRGHQVTAAYKGSAVCFYPFASLALCAPFLRILSKAVLSTGINVTRDIYFANETSQISRWCSFKIPSPSLFLQLPRFPAFVPFPLRSRSLSLAPSLYRREPLRAALDVPTGREIGKTCPDIRFLFDGGRLVAPSANPRRITPRNESHRWNE